MVLSGKYNDKGNQQKMTYKYPAPKCFTQLWKMSEKWEDESLCWKWWGGKNDLYYFPGRENSKNFSLEKVAISHG